MLRVAVTGGIACGKSTVGIFIAEQGFPICDADDLARDTMNSGKPVHRRVVEAFGNDVLAPDGTIDRRILAGKVFSDSEKLGLLNAIVHPEVRDTWRSWLAEQPPDCQAAVVIVPLLYEIGDSANWDSVICVAAAEADCRARLRARGMADWEIEARLESQLPLNEKMARADHVLFNSGTPEILKEQTRRILRKMLEDQHG